MSQNQTIPLGREDARGESSGIIYVVKEDHDRLLSLVEGIVANDPTVRDALERLEQELDRALVMSAADVPTDTVTLDSWVRLLDLDSEQELLVAPVLPSRANADAGRISVLAPLGMAVLGYRTGDTIEWRVPGGLRRLRVLSVMYQPEADARRAQGDATPGRGSRRAGHRER